jgi:hypothetical protein
LSEFYFFLILFFSQIFHKTQKTQKPSKMSQPACENAGAVRKEFGLVAGTRANTLARLYKEGKRSTIIYKAKKDKDAIKCMHVYMCCCAPCTCALCHTKELSKYTYTHLYDDRIESNVPISVCCWISDNTRVFYLDRDFAARWTVAGPCTPCCTHNSCPNKKFGGAVVAHSESLNFCCTPGSRRIVHGVGSSGTCECLKTGGPCLGECCTCLPCQYEWVCFPFMKDPETFVQKAREQREKIVQQYNIVFGKPVELAPEDVENMQRQ